MVHDHERMGVMAWVLDGQDDVHDSHLTEACSSNACAALKGVDWGVLTRKCEHRT